MRRQIWAIGQAHHKLYAGGNLDHIDLSSYIADIADQSVIGFGSLNDRVRVTMQLEPISVDVDAAIPIGLIVTELLTNAFKYAKYAFPGGRRGEVRIGLVSRSGYGELTIMDDGVGLPAERDGPECCEREVGCTTTASWSGWASIFAVSEDGRCEATAK